MRVIGVFVKVAVVAVALVVSAMLALSAFTVEVPMSSVNTKTTGDTVITTTCTWIRSLVDRSQECTTTRRSK